METLNQILETHLLPNGFEIDMDEGFKKLTERQFGGKPGRAFSELIQNAIDSYPNGTPWEERLGEIESGSTWISIKDYGEGMNTDRLKLLITLGGSDKFNDAEKIGQFGMGFMAMFNSKLGTREIVVTTRCEGHIVKLVFAVRLPGKRPDITLNIVDEKISFSTLIRVEFNNTESVKDCLEHAKDSLTYYPCKMKLNGTLFVSLWEQHKSPDHVVFNEDGCRGLIRRGNGWKNISVLCKYEPIMHTTIDHFITGGHNMRYNLCDYYRNRTPFVPGVDVVLNIDKLRVTISRDGYYLDWAYNQALEILNRQLKNFLMSQIDRYGIGTDVLMANQYILRNEIANYLTNPESYLKYQNNGNRLIDFLANASIYRINGRTGTYSLMALRSMKRPDLPLFYSPKKTNLRWLGGAFKHDFVVIPDTCHIHSGADSFFDDLFGAVFNDTVNLDTIQENNQKIIDLVKREIIDKSALSPKVKILGPMGLNSGEQHLLNEIGSILQDPAIVAVIEKNLHLKIRKITPVFFNMEDTGLKISTGLFDESGQPLNEDYCSNFVEKVDEKSEQGGRRTARLRLMLGLSLDHPFIRYMVGSNNPQRNYYALTYLAHELTLCQKMLVPYSPFYHLVKQKLALDMRIALTKNLLRAINN